MSDGSQVARSLRELLGSSTEDRLGRALSDLLDSPLLTGAIGRAVDAREKAAQAQELAMGALNLPSAADIERLTRRLRSVSLRLEGIEDAVDRLDRSLAAGGVASSLHRPGTGKGDHAEIASRLSAIEAELTRLGERLDRAARSRGADRPVRKPRAAKRGKAPSKPESAGG
jgi:hypothetical protein